MTSCTPVHRTASHASQIQDQFSRQAESFAASPSLHNDDALKLLVDAAAPADGDLSLDIACGPGSVVAAFARACQPRRRPRRHRRDARRRRANWRPQRRSAMSNSIAAMSTPCRSRRVVRYRQLPLRLPPFRATEARVCRDAAGVPTWRTHRAVRRLASDDPAKAAAFNRMELHRDPSTVEFRTLGYLVGLFTAAGLPPPSQAVLSRAGRTRAPDRRLVPGQR